MTNRVQFTSRVKNYAIVRCKDEHEAREIVSKYANKVWRVYNDSPDRWPMCDWVDTEKPTIHTMIARSVVGGFWMRIFTER